ncbi:redoxin domain-containing protein [Halococcus dombrowskii]|uniref:Peroxiredoxin n=1 Tax=Halococcus dombrowskii TaxID=179637 RepID=A0AAV3SH72_HALDO|nr:redoxin domain-containing protein [Halococcus dombrowskii]UOO95250.1 redoxin domain-containing protein [Halococcus dombrowskii]
MVEFDVVELDATDHPAAGEQAPDFTRPLVDGELWTDMSLSTLLEDGPLVLLFHPMDGAFPATYAWNEIRERGWTDEIAVVGLSISTPYAHKRLIQEREVDARLFSDPGNGVAEKYDIVNDLDGMAGVSEPRPAAFVVDADGTIQYAWVAEEWPSFPDYDAIEAAIDEL